MKSLHVREERIRCPRGGARILFASDLHLGWPWTRSVPARILDAVRDARPDALVLGGDLVERARDAEALAAMVADAVRIAPVAAVPGNHDARAGIAAVRDAVVRSGGAWLPDGPLDVAGARLAADGAQRSDRGAQVLVAHEPSRAAKRSAGFDLALAGHLHGGQFVAFTRGTRLYPWAWIDRWNGLRFDVGGAVLIVGRGAGDALPLRWNCPKEVVLCSIS